MRLWPARKEEARDAFPALSFQSWLDMLNTTSLNFNGVNYSMPSQQQESINDYGSFIQGAYKSCGVVFACMDVRSKLFAEATFQWRNTSRKLFGNPELAILEEPWPGGATDDLLARMMQHADLSGNAFVARRNGYLAMLRPDWVDIVSGSPNDDADTWDVDAQVIGYVYHNGGRRSKLPPTTFLTEEVAHWAPIPDPDARFRGMSWLTPIIREIRSDKAAMMHKEQFFANGATPNLLVKFDLDAVEKMRPWIELFKQQHEGAANAYRTLFLGAGTDATVVGSNPEQIDFKTTQGSGETRIAAAAGVPPVIVGLSEGLQAATYSNYSQARRRFADGTMRPLWRSACRALSTLVNVPNGAELWYDDTDIPALKEDIQDKAQEMREKSQAANQLVSAGYTRESIIAAIDSGDFTLLVPDPNPPSVQLQLNPPAADTVSAPGDTPSLPTGVPANGKTAPTPK
jgi:HK97 family phage portal protein